MAGTTPLDPLSIGRVVAELDDVVSSRSPQDGIGVFAAVYRDVTELIGVRLAEGRFTDATFVERLDVVFADLFLDVPRSVAGDRPVEKAWEPLVERCGERLFPVQFALAGMNAHINHDLALAVVATCLELDTTPDAAGLREDYEAVNAVLAERVRSVRQSFLDEVVVQHGAALSPLADLIGNFSVDMARDAAWVSAQTLWALRHVPFVRDAARLTLSRTVGLVSRHLLVRFDPWGQLPSPT